MKIEEFNLFKNTPKAYLVTAICHLLPGHHDLDNAKASLCELRELLSTLGVPVVGEMMQKKEKPDPATFLGQGKLSEIQENATKLGADFLAFDFELSSSQAKNIKKLTNLEVVDRVSIILEIFALHAQTSDAKIQVEISRLEYLLPRLTRFWAHLGRQKGGIGLKGEGEQQLEIDRRLIRKKIEDYKKQLKGIATSKREQTKRRSKQVLTATLVGHTNAGKSSLLNALCRESIIEENKMFSTLDTTSRLLSPGTRPPLVLTDTVGFISNLPTQLVEGFKSTFMSAKEADLLLIVVDISHPRFLDHLQVTLEHLTDFPNPSQRRLYIFTKKDLLTTQALNLKKIHLTKYPDRIIVSTKDPHDMIDLKKTITEHLLRVHPIFELFIPFEETKAQSFVENQTHILQKQFHETGTFYKVRAPSFILHQFNLQNFVTSPKNIDLITSSREGN